MCPSIFNKKLVVLSCELGVYCNKASDISISKKVQKWKVVVKKKNLNSNFSTCCPFLNQAITGAGSPVAAHCSSSSLPLDTLTNKKNEKISGVWSWCSRYIIPFSSAHVHVHVHCTLKNGREVDPKLFAQGAIASCISGAI